MPIGGSEQTQTIPPQHLERLYRVDAPHFCAGLIVSDGRVIDAAPIRRWTVGKRWVDVLEYTAEKRWLMRLVMPGGKCHPW